MSNPRISLEIQGDVVVDRVLLGVEIRTLDMRPAYREVGKDIIRWEKDLFRTAGASGGQPWALLAASTIARKAKLGQDPRILQAKRDLRKSLTVKSNPNMILDIDRDGLAFGSRLATAEFAQRGTKPHDIPNAFGSGRTVRHPGTPPRKIGQLTELHKRSVVRTVQRHIMGARVQGRRAA